MDQLLLGLEGAEDAAVQSWINLSTEGPTQACVPGVAATQIALSTLLLGAPVADGSAQSPNDVQS